MAPRSLPQPPLRRTPKVPMAPNNSRQRHQRHRQRRTTQTKTHPAHSLPRPGLPGPRRNGTASATRRPRAARTPVPVVQGRRGTHGDDSPSLQPPCQQRDTGPPATGFSPPISLPRRRRRPPRRTRTPTNQRHPHLQSLVATRPPTLRGLPSPGHTKTHSGDHLPHVPRHITQIPHEGRSLPTTTLTGGGARPASVTPTAPLRRGRRQPTRSPARRIWTRLPALPVRWGCHHGSRRRCQDGHANTRRSTNPLRPRAATRGRQPRTPTGSDHHGHHRESTGHGGHEGPQGPTHPHHTHNDPKHGPPQ